METRIIPIEREVKRKEMSGRVERSSVSVSGVPYEFPTPF